MVTITLKSVLIGILLIALIVLVVFLIVMVSKVTDILKGVNVAMEEGGKLAISIKKSTDEKLEKAKATTTLIKGIIGKVLAPVTSVLEKIAK